MSDSDIVGESRKVRARVGELSTPPDHPRSVPIGILSACVLLFWLRVRRLKEQQCVIGGVVIGVYIVVVQRQTVRPRATIIGVEDNEVDY